jgi:hypothetical protein
MGAFYRASSVGMRSWLPVKGLLQIFARRFPESYEAIPVRSVSDRRHHFPVVDRQWYNHEVTTRLSGIAMTLTLSLPKATLRQLETDAKARGVDVEAYAAGVLEKTAALSRLSFREILAPLHASVKESGLNDAEVDRLLDDAVAATRRDKSARP